MGKKLSLLNNCILIDCRYFSKLRRQYLSSAVNVLTNSPEISDISKRDKFLLNFPQIEKNI